MDENQLIHSLIDIFEYKNSYQFQSSKIHPQDMYILERIYFQKKIKIKDISTQCGIPASTLTGVIDRLESKKYIERSRTNADRRTVELITTEEGKQVLEKHFKEDEVFTQNLFSTLEKDKKLLFKKLLTELIANVEKENLFKGKNI